MSTLVDPAEVGRAFEKTGNGWILDMGGRDAILEQVALEIDEFIREYERRFGIAPHPFFLLDGNPDKAAAFFELFTNPPISLDMRIAVWDLLHGAAIQGVRFDYRRDQGAELVLSLISHRSPTENVYKGNTLGDFEIIKHLGVMSLDGREFFDGYYASKPSD